MSQYTEVRQPEPQQETGPTEMHIVKKYGKFHGHVKMGDGAEHHAAPQPSMMHAHAELGQLMGGSHDPTSDEMEGPGSQVESASLEPYSAVGGRVAHSIPSKS